MDLASKTNKRLIILYKPIGQIILHQDVSEINFTHTGRTPEICSSTCYRVIRDKSQLHF